MHKITKGLKKKKKGKKSKHKEDELFKPEELEAYRREHNQQAAENTENSTAGENEEWKKFIALTAGVDNVLKKTQGDLDRIKSTSFFQRIPTASEIKKQQQEESVNEQNPENVEVKTIPTASETAIVQISESDSEDEEEEDIFDTSYIDAIASGEVKLAYIPESPTEQIEGDDPFDTSIAERAILGPAVAKKGKKLVPIGAAVEVLTGRVQAPTCVPTKRPVARRTILKQKDLLLGSFDENSLETVKDKTPPKTLLDDDAPLPLSDEPIDLSKTLHQITLPVKGNQFKLSESKDILSEFDLINKHQTPEDEDDKEFELLAAESLSKPTIVSASIPIGTEALATESWNAFSDESHLENGEKSIRFDLEQKDFEDDPFDTTFAENILPGKAELKLIENEILNAKDEHDFNPRLEEKLSELIKSKVSIQVTDPTGQRESVSSLDRISESELNVIQAAHRDLLGGSITDLSSLGDQPLKPSEQLDDSYIEYCDPFDTSIVETATAPGQTELKFLEKELLSDLKAEVSDDDFDPRAEEEKFQKAQTFLRKVSFDLPLENLKIDLFGSGEEDSNKIAKPLTPYYIRDNSIPEQVEVESVDPFDTSFVRDAAPGKAELKLIETELFQSTITHSISDQDFNPRDEKQVVAAKVVQTIQKLQSNTKTNLEFETPKSVDLLSINDEVATKVLTPAAESVSITEEISYTDPFDTSIANNILPGKTELKLLETELISSVPTLNHLEDPDFDPRADTLAAQSKPQQDLLAHSSSAINVRTLTPIIDSKASLDFDDNIDPFDTSIANIVPGRAELKLLELELI